MEEYGVVFVGTQNIISQLKKCIKGSVCTLGTLKMFDHFFFFNYTNFSLTLSKWHSLTLFFNNVNKKKFIETAKTEQITLNF